MGDVLSLCSGLFGTANCGLTGSLSKKQKELAQAKVLSGDCDLIVGTHALIQSAVNYDWLGVAHRLTLRDKGVTGMNPHLLMMSATPIQTTVMAGSKHHDLVARIAACLSQGKQAYWV